MLAAGASAASAQVIGPGGTITGTNLTVSTLTTGVVLDASVSVSADRRYVTMGIKNSYSSLEGFQTFNFGNPAGVPSAVGVAPIPFRPAVVGRVTFVENDKKLLATPVPALALKDVSLKEGVAKIADTTKANVVLGFRGLEQAGVDLKKTHSFTTAAGTMKDALLSMIKTAAPEVDLVVTADEGVVQIVSQAQGDTNVISRTYYLQDLLSNLPRIVGNQTDLGTLKDKTDAAPQKPAAIPEGPAGVLPPAVAGPGRKDNAPLAAASVAPAAANAPQKLSPSDKSGGKNSYSTNITELITSAVRPEIWKVNGGKIGEIAVVGERVTITAPASVHAILDGPRHYNPNAVPMYVGYGTH